jgi:hypothetical protein
MGICKGNLKWRIHQGLTSLSGHVKQQVNIREIIGGSDHRIAEKKTL